MFGVLKKIFGVKTKSEKDNATYAPRVNEINAFFKQYDALSADDLRAKTLEFQTRIAEYLSDIDAEITKIRDEAIETEDLNEKEDLFKQVDALEKDRNEALETVLRDILPEAFAVVKQAAKRLTENAEIVMTAMEHDRNLAGQGKFRQNRRR